MTPPEEPSAGPVIRDRRRIDPATGQVREPGPPRPGKHAASKPGGTSGAARTSGPADARAAPETPADPAAPGQPLAGGPETSPSQGAAGSPLPGQPQDKAAQEQIAAALAQLAERTADLQRVQAEYANYRKRVERDRIAVREQALANTLVELLPILDDIGRAREHGELSGGFKSVADSLEAAAVKLGLVSYGEKGEPFDPKVHEALIHSYSDEVTEATCVQILQPGYKVGDRILRPARVAVAEPATSPGADQDAPEGGPRAPVGPN